MTCPKTFWAGLVPDQKLNYILNQSKTLGGRPKVDLHLVNSVFVLAQLFWSGTNAIEFRLPQNILGPDIRKNKWRNCRLVLYDMYP